MFALAYGDYTRHFVGLIIASGFAELANSLDGLFPQSQRVGKDRGGCAQVPKGVQNHWNREGEIQT